MEVRKKIKYPLVQEQVHKAIPSYHPKQQKKQRTNY